MPFKFLMWMSHFNNVGQNKTKDNHGDFCQIEFVSFLCIWCRQKFSLVPVKCWNLQKRRNQWNDRKTERSIACIDLNTEGNGNPYYQFLLIKNLNGRNRNGPDSLIIFLVSALIRLRSTNSWALQKCSGESRISKISASNFCSCLIDLSSSNSVLKSTKRFRLDFAMFHQV